jgi:hypothetical protein
VGKKIFMWLDLLEEISKITSRKLLVLEFYTVITVTRVQVSLRSIS